MIQIQKHLLPYLRQRTILQVAKGIRFFFQLLREKKKLSTFSWACFLTFRRLMYDLYDFFFSFSPTNASILYYLYFFLFFSLFEYETVRAYYTETKYANEIIFAFLLLMRITAKTHKPCARLTYHSMWNVGTNF